MEHLKDGDAAEAAAAPSAATRRRAAGGARSARTTRKKETLASPPPMQLDGGAAGVGDDGEENFLSFDCSPLNAGAGAGAGAAMMMKGGDDVSMEVSPLKQPKRVGKVRRREEKRREERERTVATTTKKRERSIGAILHMWRLRGVLSPPFYFQIVPVLP